MSEDTSTEMAKTDQPELFELTSKRKKKLMDVDVMKIDVPGEAAFERAELVDLADNIRRMTLLEPPILKREDGRYVPIIGRRRCAALKLLAQTDQEWKTVEMYVRTDDVSDADIAKMVLSENAQRSANVLAELDSINTLMKQDKMSIEGVAHSIGKNIGWVRRRLQLNKLSPKLRGLMQKGRLRETTAVQVAKLTRTQQDAVWEAFQDKKADNKNAILSSADVSGATSRSTVALPQELFKPLPSTEPGETIHGNMPSGVAGGVVDATKARRRATDRPHPFVEYAVADEWKHGTVAVIVWSTDPPSEAKRKAMASAVALVVKKFKEE